MTKDTLAPSSYFDDQAVKVETKAPDKNTLDLESLNYSARQALEAKLRQAGWDGAKPYPPNAQAVAYELLAKAKGIKVSEAMEDAAVPSMSAAQAQSLIYGTKPPPQPSLDDPDDPWAVPAVTLAPEGPAAYEAPSLADVDPEAVKEPEAPEPEDPQFLDDARKFLQAATQLQPFRKRYTILGGRITVEFKRTSYWEDSMANLQAEVDHRNGRITFLQLDGAAHRYQLVGSIAAYAIGSTVRRLPDLPPVKDHTRSEYSPTPPDTPLHDRYRSLSAPGNLLSSPDVTLRLQRAHSEFLGLCERITTKLDDPVFSKGIGL
jgi:hypothetical protein